MEVSWWLDVILLLCLINFTTAAPHRTHENQILAVSISFIESSAAAASQSNLSSHEASQVASKSPQGINHDVGICLQALTLFEAGIPAAEVFKITNITPDSIYHLQKKAIEQGYNFNIRLLLLHHVEDSAWSERPQASNLEIESELLINVQKDRNSHEKPLQILNTELSKWLFMSTVCCILKKYGFNSVKKTVKPGLNTAQKLAHLKWCRAHEHWTLNDWKWVIFSDETSVILNH